MDNRYVGELGSDVYGVSLNEFRLGHLQISAVQGVAADADGVHAAIASKTTAQTITTAITNPPYPRNITVTPGDTTGDIKAGTVIITGTNIADDVITEEFAFLADAADAKVGAKAFKTVTSIYIPVQDGTGASFTIGFGELIGLPLILDAKPLVFVLDDGVIATAPVITADADELEKNVIDVNGSLDGSVYDIFMAL